MHIKLFYPSVYFVIVYYECFDHIHNKTIVLNSQLYSFHNYQLTANLSSIVLWNKSETTDYFIHKYFK